MLAAVNKLFADVLKRGWMTHDGVTLSAQPYDKDATVQVDRI